MKKRKTTIPETVVETEVTPLIEQEPAVVAVITPVIHASKPSQPKEPSPTVGIESRLKKKRVRDRRKATKKLSAAVLCANPDIKRFI